MLLSRLGSLWLVATVGIAKASPDAGGASNLRGAEGDAPEGPAVDQEDRELTCTAPFSCTPSLSFLTVPAAVCRAMVLPYGTSTYGPVCREVEPTVIELDGVSECASKIASVQYILKNGKGKVLRQYTEKTAPYTVFGDDPAANTFNSRVLAPGSYTVSVVIRNAARCTLWSGIIPFTVSSEPCPEDCSDTTYYNNHVYRPVQTYMNWQQANCYTITRPKCCGARPHLITIEDPNEFDFMINSFYPPNFDYSTGSLPPIYSGVSWLGLTDVAQEGSYTWVTGEPLGAFHPWGVLQPDNYGNNEDCISTNLYSGTWFDNDCIVFNSQFVMEYECTVG